MKVRLKSLLLQLGLVLEVIQEGVYCSQSPLFPCSFHTCRSSNWKGRNFDSTQPSKPRRVQISCGDRRLGVPSPPLHAKTLCVILHLSPQANYTLPCFALSCEIKMAMPQRVGPSYGKIGQYEQSTRSPEGRLLSEWTGEVTKRRSHIHYKLLAVFLVAAT